MSKIRENRGRRSTAKRAAGYYKEKLKDENKVDKRHSVWAG
jgi:hypothetical protein